MKLSAILNESVGHPLDNIVVMVTQHILVNAKADWHQNESRYRGYGYNSFAEWFQSDYLGNSYNVESVIDNLSKTIQRRVMVKLTGNM
jgi:hypothetical protein